MADLPKDNAFGISFTTDAVPTTGIVKYVKVVLMEDTLDPDESVFVNLCEHPLYPQLERYVRANFRRKRG